MKYKKELSTEFNAKDALEAIGESISLTEIAKKNEISLLVVSAIKEEFLAGTRKVFEPEKETREHNEQVKFRKRKGDLLRMIGQLQVDNDFFASACEDAYIFGTSQKDSIITFVQMLL